MPSDPIKRLAEISGHIHILRAEARVLINQLGEHLGLTIREPKSHRDEVQRQVPLKNGRASRRRRSASGPLAPAVCEVLKQAGRPLKVKEIFDALQNAKYQLTGSNPKRSLGVRMYKLPGVRSLGDGTFTTVPEETPPPAVAEATPPAPAVVSGQ